MPVRDPTMLEDDQQEDLLKVEQLAIPRQLLGGETAFFFFLAWICDFLLKGCLKPHLDVCSLAAASLHRPCNNYSFRWPPSGLLIPWLRELTPPVERAVESCPGRRLSSFSGFNFMQKGWVYFEGSPSTMPNLPAVVVPVLYLCRCIRQRCTCT